MKYLETASYLCMMFGIVLAGLLTWIIYRPIIQHFLRMMQDMMMVLK